MRCLLLWALAALSLLSLPASADSYCCQEPSSGRRACGDSLPEICRGRPFKVLDKGGNVIKEVGPPLTPEQKATQAAEAQRKKEQEELLREQRRKDQALLDTYSSLRDIDIAQEKAEGDVKLSIAQAEALIQSIRLKRKKFEDEAEFYKKKTLPPEVEKGLQTTGHEIRLQEELRDLKKSDFATIKAKYEGDRKRYIELTGQQPKAQTVSLPSRADSRPR